MRKLFILFWFLFLLQLAYRSLTPSTPFEGRLILLAFLFVFSSITVIFWEELWS